MANGKGASGLASIFGGLTGKAVEAGKTRKKRLDEEEEKSSAIAEVEVAEVEPARMPTRRKRDGYPWD